MSIFKHPQENGMTYREHFVFAMRVGFKMFWSGLACIFHALLPCCFETTASKTIKELNAILKQHTAN